MYEQSLYCNYSSSNKNKLSQYTLVSICLHTMFLLLIDYECILRSRSSVFAGVKTTINHLFEVPCNPADYVTWESAFGPVRLVQT